MVNSLISYRPPSKLSQNFSNSLIALQLRNPEISIAEVCFNRWWRSISLLPTEIASTDCWDWTRRKRRCNQFWTNRKPNRQQQHHQRLLWQQQNANRIDNPISVQSVNGIAIHPISVAVNIQTMRPKYLTFPITKIAIRKARKAKA